jgi:hypothetical protein
MTNTYVAVNIASVVSKIPMPKITSKKMDCVLSALAFVFAQDVFATKKLQNSRVCTAFSVETWVNFKKKA